MRINKYIASSTDLSRRAADDAISQGRVLVNGVRPESGYTVVASDRVTIDNHPITPDVKHTIMLNKPSGYVVSRDGQGSKTIYSLLPEKLQHLQAVGRLDKDSSGLLLLTNDGNLAQRLTHPSHQKTKIYQIQLSHALEPLHRQMISDFGVTLDDGVSKFEVERSNDGNELNWTVTMREGRNRQIRRTFTALGYTVRVLHRTHFGDYTLGGLKPGTFIEA